MSKLKFGRGERALGKEEHEEDNEPKKRGMDTNISKLKLFAFKDSFREIIFEYCKTMMVS